MKAAFAEPEIVTHKGKPVSVILAIKDYQELLERVEDAADVAALKRARRQAAALPAAAEAQRHRAACERGPASLLFSDWTARRGLPVLTAIYGEYEWTLTERQAAVSAEIIGWKPMPRSRLEAGATF